MKKYFAIYGGLMLVTGIILVGLFVRFLNIEHTFAYGWDQARDAQIVKDIINGKFILYGPRTGIGHFHLGPLWFYLLVPFFLATQLDPIASQFANIVICTATFYILYIVTKKLFSQQLALMATAMYAMNVYAIVTNRIPWNVSLMPALSILIYFFMYKTFQEKQLKWSILLMTVSGIAFHAHLSAVIYPVSIMLLWIVSPEKKKMLLLLLKGMPFYLLWYIPTLIDHFISNQSDYYRVRTFLQDYYVGFHIRYILHRLPESLIQFIALLSVPIYIVYMLLAYLGVKFYISPKERPQLRIIFATLFSFFIIFGIYGGQLSEYYFLFTLAIVYYSFLLLVQDMTKQKLTLLLVIVFLGYYFYHNSTAVPFPRGGLAEQKIRAKKDIEKGQRVDFQEGSIHHYLYELYKNK